MHRTYHDAWELASNNAMEDGSTLPQQGVPSWQPRPAT
jgi:hypothetical protein